MTHLVKIVKTWGTRFKSANGAFIQCTFWSGKAVVDFGTVRERDAHFKRRHFKKLQKILKITMEGRNVGITALSKIFPTVSPALGVLENTDVTVFAEANVLDLFGADKEGRMARRI